MTTSDKVRPDRCRLKVFDVTNGENPIVVINKAFDSDGLPHRVKFPTTAVQVGRKYLIECYGYVDSQYVRHVLGEIKLVAHVGP